jgi:CheY-like chemotaxis protein
MPTLNGDELVAAFRHWESHNRPHGRQTFYALSAYTNEDVQRRCEVVGMEGVVPKPLRIDVVVGLLRELLEKSELERCARSLRALQKARVAP